ncbi:hypothetical protein SARC_15873, partial [Sphaeroforma arctica JP610]
MSLPSSRTPLHWAAVIGSCNMAGKTLRPHIPTTFGDNRTPLHWAAAIGSFNIVEFLVSQEVNINSSDRWETTPLEEAMNNGTCVCE